MQTLHSLYKRICALYAECAYTQNVSICEMRLITGEYIDLFHEIRHTVTKVGTIFSKL